jgi:hypothetical protein
MAVILLFKFTTRWDSKRIDMQQEKSSPQGWLEGFYQTLRESVDPPSILFKQPATVNTSFASQTN